MVGSLSDLYERWNESIANHFFRQEYAGREVFLFVDDNRIAAIGRDNRLPGGSFLEAVSPSGTSASDVARKCLELCDGGEWRKLQGAHIPPYIAHLALFVLAAGQDEEDLPDNAYYNRLRRLLHLPDGHQLPGFARLGDEVWSDLETWSATDMDGDLGIFRVRIQGAQRHVGIPRSQTLLWDEELKSLPAVFSSSGLDPTDEPSDSAIVLALLEPPRLIRPPTQRTLLRPNGDVLRRALLDVVRDELLHWDGTADGDYGPASKRTYGSIRICIKLNVARRNGSATMRCCLASPFPEGEIELTDGDHLYSCQEFFAPWSQQLSTDGTAANAAEFDWEQGVTLTSDRGYELKMRRSQVRVLNPATITDSLDG